MDSASIMAAAVDAGANGPRGVCIRSIALRRISDFFGITYDPDPSPGDPIAISQQEFDSVYDSLAADGVPLYEDREQAWRDYSGWRVNYDTVLLSLAEITMAPYAPWTSDRSAIDHNEPRLRRFGRQRREVAGR